MSGTAAACRLPTASCGSLSPDLLAALALGFGQGDNCVREGDAVRDADVAGVAEPTVSLRTAVSLALDRVRPRGGAGPSVHLRSYPMVTGAACAALPLKAGAPKGLVSS